jgi:hypothetical protein
MAWTLSSTGPGPNLTSVDSPLWARISLPKVVSATSTEVAPKSTATINPAERGIPSKDDRRPPSDAARPSSARCPASMSPATSADTLPRFAFKAAVSWALETGLASA